jgi:hypothetical protein
MYDWDEVAQSVECFTLWIQRYRVQSTADGKSFGCNNLKYVVNSHFIRSTIPGLYTCKHYIP